MPSSSPTSSRLEFLHSDPASTPAATPPSPPPDTIVTQWIAAALQAIRDFHPGPPMAARMLAITSTCIFDAWAAYTKKAVGTQLGGTLRRPSSDHTQANKQVAISYAAYRALVDLFPADAAAATVFNPLMAHLGYDPSNTTTDITQPAGIGNVASTAVLAFRRHDGANQLGDLHPGAYSDYTGYVPSNPPSTVPVSVSTITNPNGWQPLIYDDGLLAPAPHVITQTFVGAQWSKVAPFALTAPDQFAYVDSGPFVHGSHAFLHQAEELISISAHLTDKQKLIAEYWANGPQSELPPGHWCLFASFVSRRDHHTVNQDVKMFFALTNAIFDASVASWGPKRTWDSVRPVTAIPYLFTGTPIRSWVPFHGTQTIDGSAWLSYQKSTFPTPPFPEYISGHSTFSGAGAEVLRLFTGSPLFGDSVSFAPGTSVTEPGLVPSHPVTLSWPTFLDAADEAGISRRYGGIHFRKGDLVGREIGKLVGAQAWEKALTYFDPNPYAQPYTPDTATDAANDTPDAG